MRRVTGILHKMVDAAAAGEMKWSQVLNYIDSNCIDDHHKQPSRDKSHSSRNSQVTLNFDSPLPRDAQPSEILKQELWYDDQGHSLVRKLALKSAPSKIVAACVHLCPQVLLIADHRGRLPLHHACRLKPSDNQDKILMILVRASPVSVLRRDVRGRTPLHYLVWYHCPLRSPRVVAAFCQRLPRTVFYEHVDWSGVTGGGASAAGTAGGGGAGAGAGGAMPNSRARAAAAAAAAASMTGVLLSSSSSTLGTKKTVTSQTTTTTSSKRPSSKPVAPSSGSSVSSQSSSSKDLPCNAAIIADHKGCLPLHYAVMEAGTNVKAIAVLIQAYASAKHAVDGKGRTPLHWYMGASYLLNSTSTDADRDAAALHVSGEPFADDTPPWYHMPLCAELVQLIVTSRVCRTTDYRGRTPLHWAAHFWALQAWHQDDHSGDNRPPVPMESVATFKLLVDHHVGQLTTMDYDKLTPLMVLFQTTRELQIEWNDFDRPFGAPVECVDFLLTPRVASLEDGKGRLPLHAAVQVLAPAPVVETIIVAHPTALIHATERDNKTPLHVALSSRAIASRQSVEVIDLLLQSFEISKSAHVDGRLALKMEDADGSYGIHLACTHGASLEVLKAIVERYPKTALMTLPNGSLPVHCLVHREVMQAAVHSNADEAAALHKADSTDMNKEADSGVAAEEKKQQGMVDLEDMAEKMNILLRPLLADATKLQITATPFSMLPLHIAVLFQAADYTLLLRMLELYPEAATLFTRDRYYNFSPLDLHELTQPQWRGAPEEWHRIRELLFSYGPTLESHRHREELLSRCVEIVLHEVTGQGSHHLTVFKEMENAPDMPDLVLSTTLSQGLDDMPVVSSIAALQEEQQRQLDAILPPPSLPPSPRDLPNRESLTSGKGRGGSHAGIHGASSTASPAGIEHSVYDDNDVGLEYVLSDNEYEEDDSYFSSESEEEEEYFTEDEKKDNNENEEFNQLSQSQSDSIGQSGSFLTDSRSFLTGTSTGLSNMHTGVSHSFSQHDVDRIFDEAKRRASRGRRTLTSADEDDGDESDSVPMPLATASSVSQVLDLAGRPDWASPVGMRLWTFFALYRDPANPTDNYAKQVQTLLAVIDFKTSQRLANLPLPPYAVNYLQGNQAGHRGSLAKGENSIGNFEHLTFRDAANPKCREHIHRTSFFVGRFEFARHPVVKMSADKTSLQVKAYEWVFKTEEATEAVKPGVSEETIWDSGVAPAEIGLTFRASKRSVRILFTKKTEDYRNELDCRAKAALHEGETTDTAVLPIEYDYTSLESERHDDRMYRTDTADERFCNLKLNSGDFVSLGDFPYAVVWPDHDMCSVAEMLYQQGMRLPDARDVCRDVAASLRRLHEKGKSCFFTFLRKIKSLTFLMHAIKRFFSCVYRCHSLQRFDPHCSKMWRSERIRGS